MISPTLQQKEAMERPSAWARDEDLEEGRRLHDLKAVSTPDTRASKCTATPHLHSPHICFHHICAPAVMVRKHFKMRRYHQKSCFPTQHAACRKRDGQQPLGCLTSASLLLLTTCLEIVMGACKQTLSTTQLKASAAGLM